MVSAGASAKQFESFRSQWRPPPAADRLVGPAKQFCPGQALGCGLLWLENLEGVGEEVSRPGLPRSDLIHSRMVLLAGPILRMPAGAGEREAGEVNQGLGVLQVAAGACTQYTRTYTHTP